MQRMRVLNPLEKKSEQDPAVADQERIKQEIEECVIFVRLELYNRDLPCGPKAVRECLRTIYDVKPLPSERTIARILARHGLTHGRTGLYLRKRNAVDLMWRPALPGGFNENLGQNRMEGR